MNKPSPTVSVLMPVYKTREEHLRAAIESILTQTFADFEFLILDDCPEDDREQIVRSYNDPRIKYAKNERNLGITPSRNKLIDMAAGTYLAVMDHDDISLPERFAKQVSYLKAHPDVGVVGCQVQHNGHRSTRRFLVENEDIKLALMRACEVCHPASMIRKSVLTENNIRYEERFFPSEDYALWARLVPYTNFHNLPDTLFDYRVHATNTSHLLSRKLISATYAIWAFAKVENPALHEEFLLRAKHNTRIKIFGIPFFKMIRQGKRARLYLFGRIPIGSTRTDVRFD